MYPTSKHNWKTASLLICLTLGPFVALPTTSLAETGASPRVFAEPIFNGTNPYQPGINLRVKLPIAADGYSVVALRDQQKWLEGLATYQTIFDGQLYWFSNQREKDIFSAAPENYAPVLGGDCVVTFAETKKRSYGDSRYGTVHQGRIYFFADESQRMRFQGNTARYIQADIAHDGNCVVCQVDQQKKIQGLPATVATVGGLRYFFAGAHQRTTFGANLSRYGAKPTVQAQPIPESTPQSLAPDEQATDQMPSATLADDSQALTEALPLENESNNTADVDESLPARKPAMEGYCPVSIREKGIWVHGNRQYLVEHRDKVYLLAGKTDKRQFLANPQLYLPILSGDCVVSFVEKNQRISGSVFHSLQYNEQLYLFAGAEEKRAFKADPYQYSKSAQEMATQIEAKLKEAEPTQ